MPFSRLPSRSTELAFSASILLLAAVPARAGFELEPRTGFDFEYFGETYRVTENRDTVATINDYGMVAGLLARTPTPSPTFLNLDAEIYYGRESSRARLAVRGEARRGANLFLLDQEALWTQFRDDGDYALSSDSFRDTARLAWERALGDRTILRLEEFLDLVRFTDQDPYNLSSTVHRPGVILRRRVAPGGEARAAYRFGVRDVPDSSALDSIRHTGELSVGFFLGERVILDVNERLDRRIYDPVSPRESSWENRFTVDVDLLNPGLVSWRLFHESERVQFDEPDDLDFDYTRLRFTAGPVFRPDPDLDLSLAPVLGALFSSTAPAEEFVEVALEIGANWRSGALWISVTDEFGFRDYDIETSTTIDTSTGAAEPEESRVAIYSDSTYNRLTVLATWDFTPAVSFRFFGNWEPEDHRVDADDADSRIVSGGVEIRF